MLDISCMVTAFMIDHLPHVIFMDIERVGYIAHNITDQHAVMLMRIAVPEMKAADDFIALVKHDDQRICDAEFFAAGSLEFARQIRGQGVSSYSAA
jgi:hypothetical protein